MNKLDLFLDDFDSEDKLYNISALLKVDASVGLGEFDKATETFMVSFDKKIVFYIFIDL